MGKLLHTLHADNEAGHCEVKFNSKEESFYIKYYNADGKFFHQEEFSGKSIHYVKSAAENWCTGIKKLGII